jgi:hypothetical protein
VDATSAADPRPPGDRPTHRFGRIVVVGGGCYGSYYVRQLGRAQRAGAATWRELVVVDRDTTCAVARLPVADCPPGLSIVTSNWREYFASYLASAFDDAASFDDAIVPSPLMPHLMADWLLERARARWPGREVRIEPLGGSLPVPWQRVGDDGTHYASFAEWMCPINCIEPARCPKTRGPREWSLPVALQSYADSENSVGRSIEAPLVFHCTHRAFGVGMIDVRDVLDADARIHARAGADGASFLIGTVSHCHGALRRVTIAAA